MGEAMRLAPIIAIVILPVLLAACGPGNKQGTGTIVGAVAGGAAGAAIGGSEEPDSRRGHRRGGRRHHRQSDRREPRRGGPPHGGGGRISGARTGPARRGDAWSNPQSQHRGQIVPGKYYQQNGQYCRSYTHTIYIGGEPQTSRGTACRQPDGTWRTVG